MSILKRNGWMEISVGTSSAMLIVMTKVGSPEGLSVVYTKELSGKRKKEVDSKKFSGCLLRNLPALANFLWLEERF